jgi:hypothetical protein
MGGSQPTEQGTHRWPLTGEDPHLAWRAGEGERLHQSGHRGGLVAAGLVR